jgi:2-methylisocitrate lyase-like PEP mutase family enzyme
VEAAGFSAIATSSRAIAASLGFDDDDSMPFDQAFAAIQRVARAVAVPVSADIEAGYQLPATDLVERLILAGAVGCNIEDTDHHGSSRLVPADVQADRLAQIRAAAERFGVDIVLNARIDVFRFTDDHTRVMGKAIERARLYLLAGVDCVYPIRLADAALIAEFVSAVDGPVNILARNAPTIPDLARLGVARISFADDLFQTTLATLNERLHVIASELSA